MEASRSAAALEKSARGYVHYNHADACSGFRWTARESFQYMYARPWGKVLDFYSDLVKKGNGASSLCKLFPAAEVIVQCCQSHDTIGNLHSCDGMNLTTKPAKDRIGRWQRVTFKIVLSYHGGSFDGWQKQPGLNTVQGLVEKSLGRFIDEKKARQLIEKSLPVEGCAVVAGRTDKGVTALQQVCSFYTWRKDVKGRDIQDAINGAAQAKIRVLHVSEVSRVFHPNFAAKWRRYLYIFPLDQEETNINGVQRDWSKNSDEWEDGQMNEHFDDDQEQSLNLPYRNEDDEGYHAGIKKPRGFSVSKVDKLIQQLQGKLLSYRIFSRDTKASRSIGPPTECFMFHARAAQTKLSYSDKDSVDGMSVMCVELVANRFLRKMVRVLVATAIREAAAGAEDNALLKLIDATCRRATAPPAPPEGLCLVDVGYGQFKPDICFIL